MRNYAVTVAAVLAATGIRWALAGTMGDLAPFAPFYIAVLIGARAGGLKPALLATGLSMALYVIFFSEALFESGMWDALTGLGLNFGVCVAIVLFGGALHREKRRAMDHAEHLQLAEERASRAQHAAQIGVWEMDLRKGTCYYSPEFKKIHGYTGSSEMKFEQRLLFIHPEDRKAHEQRFAEALRGRHHEWIGQDRFIHPITGIRWLYSRARIEYDRHGNAVRISGTSMDITDQHEAKELLERLEERTSRAQLVAQMGTWELDIANEQAYPSPEFCKLLEKPYAECIPLQEVFEVIHPEDRPRVEEHFRQTIGAMERSYQCESRYLLTNGQVKWRLSRGEVLYDNAGNAISMVGVTVDVTDRKEAELALQHSEQRFRLATEAFNGMIYDHDLATGKVQRSEGLFELLGVHADEAVPAEDWWVARIHPEDAPKVKELISLVQLGQQPLFDLEYRVRHEAGHWVWVSDKGRISYAPDGTVVRVVGCTVDINVRKKAEMELQKADRHKDEFIATLAHELRNPLSPLQHAIDLLDEVAEDREMLKELRTMMERQMRHLVRLVDDILDLSRISRGKIDLQRSDVRIKDCIEAAVEANKPFIERMQHQLTVSFPTDDPLVYGDAERLTQVISNLLNNAAKFTPPPGRIEIRLWQQQEDVVIEVEDSGVGLEQESQDKIFEMFVQAGETTAGGLGIGLNLVRRLVVMHSGTVTVHSQGRGEGCTFRVRLPLLNKLPAEGFQIPVQLAGSN